MKKNLTKNNKGFVMVYIMLMVSAITLGVVLSISNELLIAFRRVSTEYSAAETRVLAMRCAETALMVVRNSPTSNSTATITTNGGTCTYTITGSSPTKSISIVAINDNVYDRITITTSQISPVIVSSWLETN